MTPGTILIQLSEWFPDAGYTLAAVSFRFRPPEGLYSWGDISLNIESHQPTRGDGIVWTMNSELTIRPLRSGRYYLRVVRYDPAINPSGHPFGNPRLPVDTIVTVP